jgi:hypothetical protein
MVATTKSMRLKASSAAALRLVEGFSDLTRMLMPLFASYRPELHYMRGPGPKWHAKNDRHTSNH